MAVIYGTVQRRLSIDSRVFQVGVGVGDHKFHDDGAQAVVTTHHGDTRFPDHVIVMNGRSSRAENDVLPFSGNLGFGDNCNYRVK